MSKIIVIKTEGKWQLMKIEDGEIFTDNMKAVKYLDDAIKADNEDPDHS